jgi:uncharacterized protein YcaQ
VTIHHLSRTDARRIAVRAQLLSGSRPATGLLDVVRHLTLLQLDPTAAIAPNADLVLWSRLGSSSYHPDELKAALADHHLLEYRATIRPRKDLGLYRARMATWPGTGTGPLRPWQERYRDWVRANDACRRDILARLAASGPLPSREFPDTCAVPWQSTGWTNNRNITQLLELMVLRGEIAVSGRSGATSATSSSRAASGERLWDLAARVYANDPIVPVDEAVATRNERRLHALGIARARSPQVPVEPADVGEAGEPAEVEGVPGMWRVEPSLLGQPFTGRAALLSPFDRLVHDRARTLDLFGFEYQLEMYKPVAARRWGYFALPILFGDELIGKLDATADRKTGTLRVNAIHQDVPFTKPAAEAVHQELEDLATWLGLDLNLNQDRDRDLGLTG